MNVDRFPAFGFVATAIDDTMVGAAKGNRELIAHSAAQSARLRQSRMIGRPTGVRTGGTVARTRIAGVSDRDRGAVRPAGERGKGYSRLEAEECLGRRAITPPPG
jgi:hypothetical protein